MNEEMFSWTTKLGPSIHFSAISWNVFLSLTVWYPYSSITEFFFVLWPSRAFIFNYAVLCRFLTKEINKSVKLSDQWSDTIFVTTNQ